jgi:hypothetical protein
VNVKFVTENRIKGDFDPYMSNIYPPTFVKKRPPTDPKKVSTPRIVPLTSLVRFLAKQASIEVIAVMPVLKINVMMQYMSHYCVSGFSKNWNDKRVKELRPNAIGIMILEDTLSTSLPAGITTRHVAMTETTFTCWIIVWAWIGSDTALET